MGRGLQHARAEQQRAVADVERWSVAVAQGVAAVEAAERADVEDPSDLDAVGQAAARAQASLAAARRAQTRSVARLREARRAVLVAEARDEDAAAKSAERLSEEHAAKVRALVGQLLEIDGVTYVPEVDDGVPEWQREPRPVAVSRGAVLGVEARRRRVRAGVLRHVAGQGRLPNDAEWRELGVMTWVEDPHGLGMVPESVTEYLAALAGV